MFVPNDPAPGDDVLHIRLASLLSNQARWSQLALKGLPNELVDVGFFFFFDDDERPSDAEENNNK